MNYASATFGGQPSASSDAGLQVATVCPTLRNAVLDETAPPQIVWGARAAFEKAVLHALESDAQYPTAAGVGLLRSLRWTQGYPEILKSQFDLLGLAMSETTWHLLPEMVPVPPELGGPGWLDARNPLYRSLGRVEQAPAGHLAEFSLVILYENTEEFPRLARDIQRALSSPRFRVELRNCFDWSSDRNDWHDRLTDLFHTFRAVLFLGHFYREGSPHGHGWELRPGLALPMTYVNDFLAPAPKVGKFTFPDPVPEVLFLACCAGASDLAVGGNLSLPFPKLFLDAGIRYFIGSWMDIAGVLAAQSTYLEVLQRFIVAFFRRWADEPDEAVYHLYSAKQECNFHLLTSLFQMYAAGVPMRAGSSKKAVPERSAPETSALVGSLHPGDRLGLYRLGNVAWKTSYSRSFWASNAVEERFLLQIPVDNWQGIPDLVGRIENALQRLRKANLGESHLIADRCELLPIGEARENRLVVLVHDYSVSERDTDWRPLATRSFDPSGVTHFADVLHLGAAISLAVSELHRERIRHGNLDLENIVLRAGKHGDRVVLKDAWIHVAGLGRCASPEFGAPEEPLPPNSPDELKIDIWSLGILLFTLATGEPPASVNRRGREPDGSGQMPSVRAALGRMSRRVPAGLERLVRECLAPSPTLRPNSTQVCASLGLAVRFGGAYVSQFDRELRNLVAAGQRLIAVLCEEVSDLDSALDGLQQLGHRVFVIEDELGLVDRQSGEVAIPWVDGQSYYDAKINQQIENGMEPNISYPTSDEVGAANFVGIVSVGFPALRRSMIGDLSPIALVRGSTWWGRGEESVMTLISRGLRNSQELRAPVVIVADRFLSMEENLSRSFKWLRYPPPSPAELFENILDFVEREKLAIDPVSEETAIELAHQLYPCGQRDLTETLRLCALKHGSINRVLDMWDEQKEMQFVRVQGISFIPISRLPQPGHLGLPDYIERWLDNWAGAARAALEGQAPDGLPRRLLVSGPIGYGKTTFALMLGRITGRPVIRIEAESCLRGYLGVSEKIFRDALHMAASPQGTIVLIDDVERFFAATPVQQPGPAGGAPRTLDPMGATVARMSSILLNWMDRLTPMTTLVLASAEPDRLPASFQWRVEQRVQLWTETGPKIDGPIQHAPSTAYRSRAFAAILARCGDGPSLLASDEAFVRELARRTHPTERIAPLSSPFAIASKVPVKQTVRLGTGAAIENWIQETLLLHARRDDPSGDPAKPDFWLSKT